MRICRRRILRRIRRIDKQGGGVVLTRLSSLARGARFPESALIADAPLRIAHTLFQGLSHSDKMKLKR